MTDPTLIAAKKLREYEEKHPFQAIVGGFTPGIGQASAAAALRDPDAPWWEKALNAPGLIPGVAGASKAIVIGAKLAKGSEALEDSLKVAKALLAKGKKVAHPVGGEPLRDTIFRETGWWKDPDTGKWMTELDDSKSMPDFPFMEQAELNQVFGKQGQTMSLADVLRHPELEKLPEGQKFLQEVQVERNPLLGKRSGEFRPSEDVMGFGDDITPENASVIRDTLLHEPTHAIARREGFRPGTNSRAAGGFENYMKDPGEMLARVVPQRRNMTAEARRKYPLYKHMDDERYRVMQAGESKRYANEEDLKRALMLRNLDPEEMLVKGP